MHNRQWKPWWCQNIVQAHQHYGASSSVRHRFRRTKHYLLAQLGRELDLVVRRMMTAQFLRVSPSFRSWVGPSCSVHSITLHRPLGRHTADLSTGAATPRRHRSSLTRPHSSQWDNMLPDGRTSCFSCSFIFAQPESDRRRACDTLGVVNRLMKLDWCSRMRQVKVQI